MPPTRASLPGKALKSPATSLASRGADKEACELKREPGARRWTVEVTHSWFNCFRKILVRYEKLHCTYVALNHLAAAIIAFRKVPLTVNIIYG